MNRTPLYVLALLVFGNAAQAEETLTDLTNSAAVALFEERILPVLQEKCYRCHEAGKKTRGDLALDSHAAMLRGGDNGPALVPGDADASLLYLSITYEDPDFEMPPKEQLPASVVADFKRWIAMGAPFPGETLPGSPIPTSPDNVLFTTITAIDGSWVTFLGERSGGRGKGGTRMGRSRGSSSGESLEVTEDVLVTTASIARRTQDLLVGIELGGGLRNPVFNEASTEGVRARLVLEGERITEINVILSDSDNETPIAVKPQRPPLKKS